MIYNRADEVLPDKSGEYKVIINVRKKQPGITETYAYYYAETNSWSISNKVIMWKQEKKGRTK